MKKKGWTALHYASLNGNIQLVNIFLYKGVDVDAETSSKLTPLMIAC